MDQLTEWPMLEPIDRPSGPTDRQTDVWTNQTTDRWTNQPTDRWTNQPTDWWTNVLTNTASHKDARTHLKKIEGVGKRGQIGSWLLSIRITKKNCYKSMKINLNQRKSIKMMEINSNNKKNKMKEKRKCGEIKCDREREKVFPRNEVRGSALDSLFVVVVVAIISILTRPSPREKKKFPLLPIVRVI